MKHSPWGAVQHETVIAPGITSCSTAGHGGFHLDQEHRQRIKWAKNWLGTSEWWEEDCDWAIPFYFFREEIKANNHEHFDAHLEAAIKTIIHYHPEFAKREGLGG